MRKDILLSLLAVIVFAVLVPITLAQTVTSTICTQVGDAPGETPCKIAPGNFVFYCQADPQWNTNGCRVDIAGCGPTSMAMIISSFGFQINPLEMDAVFRRFSARPCGNVGSTTGNFFGSGWLAENGFEHTSVALNSNGTLNLTDAKRLTDEGFLIFTSSEVFPCPPGGFCRVAGATVNHIFAISALTDANVANNTFPARDPINCNASNTAEIEGNITKANTFPLLYAWAIRRTNPQR